MAFVGLFIIFASFLTVFVHAQCPADFPGCGSILPLNTDTDCGVDPHDGSFLGIYAGICPCNVGDVFMASVTYTGLDQQVTTMSSATTALFSSSAAYVTFEVLEQNTAIQAGSDVTVVYDVNGAEYPALSFTSSPVTSIFYTPSTLIVTTTSETEILTTSLVTVSSTTVIPKSTVTQPCTTGTAKQTKSTTVRMTHTITPSPKTVEVPRVIKTTTHLSCLPDQQSQRPQNRREIPRMDVQNRQVNIGAAETPYCPAAQGNPISTTYEQGIVVTSSTSTSTDTGTITMTSTTTITSTPALLTTTVCRDPQGTTTTTVTLTDRTVKTAKQSTHTVSKTYHVVVTEYASHATLCDPRSRPTQHTTDHCGEPIQPKSTPSPPKKTNK